MMHPLQITFHGFPPSDALSDFIREHVQKLEKFSDEIVSCHVVVEQPHQHKNKGKHFHVRIELGVPKQQLVANSPDSSEDTENAYAAVSEAFKVMKRQLQEHVARLREMKPVPAA